MCNSCNLTKYDWVVPWGATRCRPLLNFLVKSPSYVHRIVGNVQWNRHCWASAPLCSGSQFTWMEWPVSNVLLTQVNIGQIYSFLFLIIPGHVMMQLLNMHRRCWPKEDWDIQRQCTLKWISKKSMIFRSSLRYRPWGMLVGVSGSYPTKAVALLLGESRAYDLNQWWLDHWRIYASLGLNELMQKKDVTLLLTHWSHIS